MAGPRPELRVRRHVALCRVYGGRSADASAVATAVTELLSRRLAVALEAARVDDGFWLIRRLDVHAAVAIGWEPRRIADALAAQVTRAVAGTVADGADGDSVLWFPDRAAFLGRFLHDVAEGRAAGRWEYGELGPMLRMPAGRVLPELARADAVETLDAVLRLASAEREAVLRLLTPQDADQLLSLFAAARGRTTDDVDSVLGVLPQLVGSGRLAADPRQGALALALAVGYDRGPALVGAAAGPARALARLAGMLRELAPYERARVARALSESAWSDLVELAGPALAAACTAVAAWPAQQRVRAVEALIGPAQANVDDASATVELVTPFGGMFLLLPLLAELPWAEATRGWPSLHGFAPHLAAGWLAVGGALGGQQCAAALADEVLRLALDVPDWIGPHDVAPWIGAVPPELVARFEQVLHDYCVDRGRDVGAVGAAGAEEPDARPMQLAARTLLAELAARLPGMAGSTPGYLRRNLLDLAATVRVEPDRFVVELTDPPLHLLLSLTGMNRRRFRLDATGDASWVLAPRG